jgi:lactate permease
VLAIVFWGFPLNRFWGATLEGVAFALWPILLVILAAIFTFKLAELTGALSVIRNQLTGITTDRRIQVLILAWGFGGFLEAVAGYGTAVAIPASILAMLGLHPVFAAVLSLIANTVPTAFGAVGIPVSTLAALTGLDPGRLSLAVGIQLTPFIVAIPFVLVVLTGGGLKALKGVFGVTLVSGLGFAIPQLVAAAFLGPELPALLGSIGALGATIGYTLLFHREDTSQPRITALQTLGAWLPYILIFVFVLAASPLVPPIHRTLGAVHSSITFFQTGRPVDFKWISTPGVLILAAAITGALAQGARPGAMIRTLGRTARNLLPAAITVLSILALAKVLDYSGMIATLAAVLVSGAKGTYPLFAPLLGALGTFVTGSDTSSNILFGRLQVEVATQIGESPTWLAAANTTGATAGKMISPQSIAIATGATGLIGEEGRILRQTLGFCLVYVLVLGLGVWLFSPWIPL